MPGKYSAAALQRQYRACVKSGSVAIIVARVAKSLVHGRAYYTQLQLVQKS